jgi:predicted ATP-binding protein involved in virulence
MAPVITKYKNDNINIDMVFENNSFWLNLNQISELYQINKSAVSQHIKNIFKEGELDEKSVVRHLLTKGTDGESRNTAYYNLDMIIIIGYRVKSPQSKKFRIWATQKIANELTLKEKLMNEYFVQKLTIKDVRDIKNFEIPLDENERKHLIITGKNGCGKTSTLNEIDSLLNKLINNQFAQISQNKKNIENYRNIIKQALQNIENYQKNIEIQKQQEKLLMQNEEVNQIAQIEANIQSYTSNIINEKTNIQSYENQISQWQKQIDDFSKVELVFSNQSEIYENIVNGKFILAFFKAKRHNEPTIPNTPTKQTFQPKYQTTAELNKTFLQYLLNLKTEQAFAQIRNDSTTVNNISFWFNTFEIKLRELFEQEALKLVFNDKEFNFKIAYGNKIFGLNELSDGYSSLLAIVTELILRMEAQNNKAYDMQGVVLIDEIETHLHVELQKKVLPFLVGFFPKIQFIVTTHSPFVLSSLSNAMICDLEKKLVTSDLSAYSYDALVESYFDSDKYSSEIKNKIDRFEELSKLSTLSGIDKDEYMELKRFFKTLPTYKADEIAVKIKEILRNDVHKG